MVARSAFTRRRFLLASAGVAAAAMAPVMNLAAPASAQGSNLRTINANGVRLRSGAGLRFSVVRVLNTGEQVELIGLGGFADGYEWAFLRVSRTGETGNVASQFLSPVSGGSYPIGSTYHVDTANGGGAFLRAAASTSAAVVRVVANGTNGTIQSAPTQASGYTWHQVSIAGSTGWMATVVMAPGSGGGSRPRVSVKDGPLNVRQTAGLSGTVILVAQTGATGEVTEQMPITRDGYVWVNVHFFNQANTTGWVAQAFLAYAQ